MWPAGTLVEYDQGLNAVVKRLREALGDSAEKPRFIETLPKRGYRFIAVTEPESRCRSRRRPMCRMKSLAVKRGSAYRSTTLPWMEPRATHGKVRWNRSSRKILFPPRLA